MNTEMSIQTAAKLLDARDAMRSLHGDSWPQKIKEVGEIIRDVARYRKTSLLIAALQMAKKASRDDQAMIAVMVLAVACELESLLKLANEADELPLETVKLNNQ